jgi:type VI secretion system ImpM family protein
MHQLESGFYGKLPAAGDFQKSLSAHGPGLEFFNWFNDGWVRTVLVGKRPVPTYPLRFAWLGAGCVTIGVIHPSHDQSGRRFPLFVFTVVAEVRDFGVLLAAAESWWLRADDAAASATRGLSAANLRLHVESLRCDLAGEVPEVEGAEVGIPGQQPRPWSFRLGCGVVAKPGVCVQCGASAYLPIAGLGSANARWHCGHRKRVVSPGGGDAEPHGLERREGGHCLEGNVGIPFTAPLRSPSLACGRWRTGV